ncbi:MAG: hypothetical protein M1819_007335 [Sarea resinae]|nr:MAG: hypothetical protein M1819_007335 [Sarea resinae]
MERGTDNAILCKSISIPILIFSLTATTCCWQRRTMMLMLDPSEPNGDYIPTAAILSELPDHRYEVGPAEEEFCHETRGPVLRAAQNQDIRFLRGLLHDGRFQATTLIVGPLEGPWDSALITAILSRLPVHVELLLQYGANVNGFPDWCFSAASSRFVRGRPPKMTMAAGCSLPPRTEVLKQVEIDQTASITEDELQERRQSRSRFWAEPNFPRTDYPVNSPLTAISACVKVGAHSLIESLAAKGADEAAWQSRYDHFPPETTPSYLAVETPLHVAVEREDESMLRFLLDRHHKPDIFPLVLVTRCLNATMATIAKTSPWLHGFDILTPHSNLTLRTPIFGCHILHLAVATLDLDLLRHVLGAFDNFQTAMNQVLPTSLGHTLLHIACLPLDDTTVNLHSLPIYKSIHEFRTPNTAWKRQNLRPSQPQESPLLRGGSVQYRTRGGSVHRRGGLHANAGVFSQRPSVEDQSRQKTMIQFLLAQMSDPRSELGKQDVHGNTALHYLASYRQIDDDLLAEIMTTFLGDDPDGGDIPDSKSSWSGMANFWGFTAQNLFHSGVSARKEWGKDYMSFWQEIDATDLHPLF